MPQLDSATRSVLASRGIDLSLLDPPSMTATESAAGHKIESMTSGSTTETLHYPQSQRTEDEKNWGQVFVSRMLPLNHCGSVTSTHPIAPWIVRHPRRRQPFLPPLTLLETRLRFYEG
ncbi:MAG: hypothetical protein WBX15_07005 [Thermoanaerobaculia bacterium]